MYLTNYDSYIRQIIPPHWRDQWQEQLIKSLCSPLRQLMDEMPVIERAFREEVNINSQVMALEAKLNELLAYEQQEVTIVNSSTNGAVVLRIPNDLEKIKLATAHLQKVLVAGKQLTIQTY